MINISSPSDALKGHHYLIVIFKTTSIHHAATEGDERSRTNPGHGYPAQSAYTQEVKTPKIQAYQTKEELLKELKRLYESDRNRKDILIFEVNGTISVSLDLNVSLL